jgi:hypothetical protein
MKLSFLLVLFAYMISANAVTDQFLEMIETGIPYKIQTAQMQCPSIILPVINENLPTQKLKDDVPIELRGFEIQNGRLSPDYFTHENHRILYRPGIPSNKRHKVSGDCLWGMGAGCNSSYQEEEDGVFKFYNSAKIVSLVMVAFSSRTIVFDSKKNTISYIFKGNGIDDVVCNYSPAPDMVSEMGKLPAVDDSSTSSVAEKSFLKDSSPQRSKNSAKQE